MLDGLRLALLIGMVATQVAIGVVDIAVGNHRVGVAAILLGAVNYLLFI